MPGHLTKQWPPAARYLNHSTPSKGRTRTCQEPLVMTQTEERLGSSSENGPRNLTPRQAGALLQQCSSHSFTPWQKEMNFWRLADAELARILNNRHSYCKTWKNSLKSLCRKLEYVSLKAMSGAHRRAVRSLTTSVFDQVLLGVEGRTCGDGKRKLARESLLEHLEGESQAQSAPYTTSFPCPGPRRKRNTMKQG